MAVTRAFGDFSLKKTGVTCDPDVRRISLTLEHKYLIVASDGLWDFVEASKIY